MSSLTPKQAAFVQEYLLDFNATAAAGRAGYTGNSSALAAIGSHNLANPAIRERIHQHLQDVALNAQQVINRLAHHARGSMADFVSQGPSGEVEVDLAKALSLGAMDRVRFLVFDESRDDDGFLRRRRVEISLHDSLVALTQLLKAYQLPDGALATANKALSSDLHPETPEQALCAIMDSVLLDLARYFQEHGSLPPLPAT